MNQYNPDIIRSARFRPLPLLPQALEALCEIDGAASLDDLGIADVVSREPALMLQTLRITPVRAADGTPISEYLSAAIRRLGRPGLQLLATGVLSRYLELYLRPSFLSAYTDYWYQSVTTAVAARHLAIQMGTEDSESAYLCGLLLRIGHIPLMLAAAQYNRDVPGGPGEDHHSARLEGAIGEALLEGVSSLGPAADVIRYRCYPLDELKTALPLVRTVAIADMIATGWLALENMPDEGIVTAFTGLTHLQLESVRAAVAAEMAQVQGMFQMTATPAIPPGLIRHLAKGAARQAETDAFSGGNTQTETLTRLSQTLGVRFGIHACIVWRHSPGAHLLEAVFSVAPTGAVLQMRPLPIDAPHAVATAYREKCACLRYADEPAQTIVIADRQMMDMLRAGGLVCVPFGRDGSAAGVVMGGFSAGSKDDVAGSLEDIRHTIAAALERPDAGDASASLPAGDPLSSDALARLMVKKTAHEIRTPLSIIKNYLSVLRLKLPQTHTAQSELGTIAEEIDRIGAIMEQLILPSSDSAHEWLLVNDIVRQMLMVIQAQLASPAAVTISADLDEALPSIYSDRDKIKQIVLNLMKNALEALPEGGNIRVCTRSGRPMAPGKLPETITLVVGDDGPGISDTVRARMFQPFNSTKSTGDRGLGLHIVRSAVAALCGSIRFASAEGQGTEVLVELPVDPESRNHA